MKETTTPRDRSAPIRTCVGCRERRPQSALQRCILDADGVVHASRTAAGRGAWICGPDCLVSARRRRGFEHAWRTQLAPGALDGLTAELSPNSSTSGNRERPGACETDTTTKG